MRPDFWITSFFTRRAKNCLLFTSNEIWTGVRRSALFQYSWWHSLRSPRPPQVNWLLNTAPRRDEPGSGKRAAVIKRLICEESNREKREWGEILILEDRKGILHITHNITWSHHIKSKPKPSLILVEKGEIFPWILYLSSFRFSVEVSRSILNKLNHLYLENSMS